MKMKLNITHDLTQNPQIYKTRLTVYKFMQIKESHLGAYPIFPSCLLNSVRSSFKESISCLLSFLKERVLAYLITYLVSYIILLSLVA